MGHKTRVSFSISMGTKKRMDQFKFLNSTGYWSELVEAGLVAILDKLEKEPEAEEKYGYMKV